MIGNARDVLKYINALDGRRGPALLNSASLASIIQRPPYSHTGEFAGLAWRITPVTSGHHWWHSGGANGTRNLLTRRVNNRNWVVLMNMRPEDENTILSDLFAAFSDAESKVTSWPTHDLFAEFGGPQIATDLQELSFQHLQHNPQLPPVQTVRLTATPTNVNFSIATPEARWLKVDKFAGVTPDSIRVSVDPIGLTPGEHKGQFTILAPQAANGSRTVGVTLRVLPPLVITRLSSSASQEVLQEASVLSRLTAELPAELKQLPVVSVGGVEATVVSWAGKLVDFVVPTGSPTGDSEILFVPSATEAPIRGPVRIVELSPALFVPMMAGPKGTVLRSAEGAAPQEIYECAAEGCKALPIDLGPESETVSLRIPATGIRARTAVEDFSVTIGDTAARVTAVEASADVPGLDWLTVTIPRSLEGRGEAAIVLTVAEKSSNSIRIAIK